MLSRRQLQLVGALVLTGLLAACTPTPTQNPSPTPTPTFSPPETEAQRLRRLDFEAAEKSYRAMVAEVGRVLRAGGSKTPTPAMRRYAGGPYLNAFAEVADAYVTQNAHQEGALRIVWVREDAYSPSELNLVVCEDGRSIERFEGRKSLGNGEIRTADLIVRKLAGSWKVWSGKGRKVSACPA